MRSNASLRHHRLPNKNPRARYGLPLFNLFCQWGPRDPLNLTGYCPVPDYPTAAEGETLPLMATYP